MIKVLSLSFVDLCFTHIYVIQILTQFRTTIGEDINRVKFNFETDDDTLCRFLRARKFDPVAAETMIRQVIVSFFILSFLFSSKGFDKTR